MNTDIQELTQIPNEHFLLDTILLQSMQLRQ